MILQMLKFGLTTIPQINQLILEDRETEHTQFFVHSKKALTAEAVKDGANVSQATYTGSNLQHWKLSKHRNGFTVQLAGANEYLNVRLAMARDGANVQTWSNGGTIETLFKFEIR